MKCAQARQLLSAGLNRDPDPILDRHVESCPECRRWSEEAHRINRTMLQVAPTGSTAMGQLRLPHRFWALRVARFALAWIGALLIAFNIPDLFAEGIDIELIHLSRHQSAFSMALGVSFLFVAWRPDRAYGLVPIAAVFAIMLSGATFDLLNGASTFEREAIHIVEIIGLVIIWILGINAGPVRRMRGGRGDQPLRAVEEE